MEFNCNHLDELAVISKSILNQFQQERIFIFRGELGAGKTTLIKEICRQLEVTDPTNSPSFSIVNEYNTRDGLKLFHFDFYRIKKLAEVFDIGYEEYFYGGSYCFIEWPELIEDILPENYVEIKITWEQNDSSRTISVAKKN